MNAQQLIRFVFIVFFISVIGFVDSDVLREEGYFVRMTRLLENYAALYAVVAMSNGRPELIKELSAIHRELAGVERGLKITGELDERAFLGAGERIARVELELGIVPVCPMMAAKVRGIGTAP